MNKNMKLCNTFAERAYLSGRSYEDKIPQLIEEKRKKSNQNNLKTISNN